MVDAPQFRPAATPVNMAALAGPIMSAPQPVQAPRAAAPSMPDFKPRPAPPTDNGFITALNNFGSSLSRLGGALQEQYRMDAQKQDAQATAEIAKLTPAEALAYVDRVKLEAKSKANVDGTLQAYGRILASRLPNEVIEAQASGKLPLEQVPDYVRNKTKMYQERFGNSEVFNKIFSPVAADVVTRYEGEVVKKRAQDAKDTFINGKVAEAMEGLPSTLTLLPEQRTSVIHKWIDDNLEAAAKSGRIDKADVNDTMLKLAVAMADKGDRAGVEAILSKPRGDQPSFIASGDHRATQLLEAADDQLAKLNKYHNEDLQFAMMKAARDGRLGNDPTYKLFTQNREAVYKLGISGSAVASLESMNQTANRNSAYIDNPDFVSSVEDAIQKGRPDLLPSRFDKRVERIYGLDGFQAKVAQAQAQKANIAAASTALDEQNNHNNALSRIAVDASNASGSEWVTRPTKSMTTLKGLDKEIKFDEWAPKAAAVQFSQIDKQFAGNPQMAASAKVAWMLERNFIPDPIVNTLKRGAMAMSADAITAQTPEAKQKAFDAQLSGLGLYRMFSKKGGLPTMEDVTNKQTTQFYSLVDTLSTVKYGGDDLAAMSEIAIGSQRDDEAVRAEMVQLSKAVTLGRLTHVRNKIEDIPGLSNAPLLNPNFINTSVKPIAESFVRLGIDGTSALDAAGEYVAKTYTSYKGIAVPRGGDQTYADVQDFFVGKLKETYPQEMDVIGDVALAPVVAASQFGASGIHSLFSLDHGGAIADQIGPITFKQRDGTDLVVRPNHMPIETVAKLRDVMAFDNEQKALAKRSKLDLNYMPITDDQRRQMHPGPFFMSP